MGTWLLVPRRPGRRRAFRSRCAPGPRPRRPVEPKVSPRTTVELTASATTAASSVPKLVRRDSAEPLTGQLSRLHVTVSRRFLEKLEAARAALSHARPGASAEDVLEIDKGAAALDLACRPWDARALASAPTLRGPTCRAESHTRRERNPPRR